MCIRDRISFAEYKKLWLPPKPAKLRFSVLGVNYTVPLSLNVFGHTVMATPEEARTITTALGFGVTLVPFAARLLGGSKGDAFSWTLVVLFSVIPGVVLGKLGAAYLDRR